jgi:hypothetical protein
MRKGLSYSEAGKLGAAASKEFIEKVKLERVLQYNKDPNLCQYCQRELSYEKRRNKYCSRSCSAKVNNSGINRWKNSTKLKNCSICNASLVGKSGKKYCSRECHNQSKWNQKVSEIENGSSLDIGIKAIKRYLLETRGHKCEECSNTVWQNKPIPLELDHIDGCSENNDLNNLRLICPNCHALTPTYKGKNAGNGRAKRRQRYKEGKSY